MNSKSAPVGANTQSKLVHERFDHRLKKLVRTTGDIAIATENGVPASTARGWLRQSHVDVVSLELLDLNSWQLQHEVIKFRRRAKKLSSLLGLAIVVLQVYGFSIGRFRVSEGRDKKRLRRAIERTRPHIVLRTSYGAIGLSRTRYHEWSNIERCELEDRPSCLGSLSPVT